MKLNSLTDKIVEHLPKCSTAKIKYIWNVLYEDWEECPEDKQEAIELIEEELSCLEEIIKIKKIHKKIFNEDPGEQ